MKILRTKEVTKLTGLSRVSIWRYERSGNFPRHLQLGPNSIGWKKQDILDWIETRPRGLSGHQMPTVEVGVDE